MNDRVCVARPRIERLFKEMEREAVGLLAALLADAVRRGDAGFVGMPSADTPSNPSSIPSSN
jgi:hypothetical protein